MEGERCGRGRKSISVGWKRLQMQILGMVCPDVGTGGVREKVFRSLGCCCDQQGGQLWFPLEGLQSQLRVNFLQNMIQKRNIKKLIPRQVFSWHFPLADPCTPTALSEVLCSTCQRIVRQCKNISIQLKPIFLFFSAAWNCLECVCKQI